MENPGGSNNSGRSGEKLTNTLAGYSTERVQTMERALLNAGYTTDQLPSVMTRAVNATNPALAAHGTGARGSGTQGNFDTTANDFRDNVVNWAANNPRVAPSTRGNPSARHNQQQQAEAASSKATKKVKAKLSKHDAYHEKLRNEGKHVCPGCGKNL
jgi:hypothetical protein